MPRHEIELMLIFTLVSAACAIPGVFLVLRRMALLSDAISHVILLGIVLAFLVVRDLSSPWLVVGATLSGVLTVVLVELLQQTGRLREDAAIGLVFPALFGLGVILVSRSAGNIHLDVDSVLLGEPLFAAIRRFRMNGVDIAPFSLVMVGLALCLTLTFIGLFYKELKLATFDAGLATSLGFAPRWLHYGLMTLIALTAVVSFDAVGAVVVVGLMTLPAMTALLFATRLSLVLLGAATVAIGSGLAGYRVARFCDISVPGTITVVLGLAFVVGLCTAPQRGLIANWLRRRRRLREFDVILLLVHLLTHEGTPQEDRESQVADLHQHLHWPTSRVRRVIDDALSHGWIETFAGKLRLTDTGRRQATTL